MLGWFALTRGGENPWQKLKIKKFWDISPPFSGRNWAPGKWQNCQLQHESAVVYEDFQPGTTHHKRGVLC